MSEAKVDIITYDGNISQREIPYFRGAVIASVGKDADTLFHNHKEDGVLYGYPKIQYKRLNGRAAVVCVNEGTELAWKLLSSKDRILRLGNREAVFKIASFSENTCPVKITDGFSNYSIGKWLALNQENHSLYMSVVGLADKYAMLERIMTANLLSFAKGIGSTLEGELIVRILEVRKSDYCDFKKIRMLGFDLSFCANISLPDFIGLGKGVSLGYGTIHRL